MTPDPDPPGSPIAPSPGTALPDAHRLLAPEAAAGLRADRFLADAIGTLSRSRVKALIEAGHVTRDGAPVAEPAEPVRAGSLYEVRPPAPVAAEPAAQAIPFPILHEDAHLLVLDKPAGLVVHPAPGHEDGTLVNALLAHCGDSLPGIGGERRPGIVHRLDTRHVGRDGGGQDRAGPGRGSPPTSRRGASSAPTSRWPGACPRPRSGELDGPIGRDPRERKRMAVVRAGGKAALTRYRTTAVHHLAAGRAGAAPGDRADPPDTRAPGRRRAPAGGRPGLPASHPRPGPHRCPTRCAAPCWTSRARRCTPAGSASAIRPRVHAAVRGAATAAGLAATVRLTGATCSALALEASRTSRCWTRSGSRPAERLQVG